MAGVQAHWNSRFGFIMASSGFAVGLGNIWRFPYVTGENGGAAFVVIYLICVFVIGIPILMAELLIGRRGGLTPPGSMRALAQQEGQSTHWQWAGGLNLLAAFLVQIVYCIIAGWVLLYLYLALTTGFTGNDAAASITTFESLKDRPGTMLLWTWTSLLLTGAIVFAGVEKGIERTVTILMPFLFLLLMVLVIFNIFSGGFETALTYLFQPDFSKISAEIWLEAMGQAFFSIGVALAGMMVYGAYLPKNVSIASSVWIVVIADTLVALLAGLIIFPVVFNFGFNPDCGPGLIFQTLPVAFAKMPGGHLFSAMFFLLLSIAAITSMVGLVESLTAWLEEHHGFKRHQSTLTVFVCVGLISSLSIFSYCEIANLNIAGRNFNDILGFVSYQLLLPIGGLLIALFAGWFISSESCREELQIKNEEYFKLWRFLIRWPVPIAVLGILIMGITG